MAEDVLRQVMVYATGMVYCSACAPADMPVGEVEERVNTLNPTGISSRWSVSDDPTFASGSPNPSPCDVAGPLKLHYLLAC